MLYIITIHVVILDNDRSNRKSCKSSLRCNQSRRFELFSKVLFALFSHACPMLAGLFLFVVICITLIMFECNYFCIAGRVNDCILAGGGFEGEMTDDRQ